MAWKTVKVIDSADGDRRVEIAANAELGVFTYSAFRHYPPDEEDEGALPDGLWVAETVVRPGYFETAEIAEQEARRSHAWLGDPD